MDELRQLLFYSSQFPRKYLSNDDNQAHLLIFDRLQYYIGTTPEGNFLVPDWEI